MLDYHDLYLKTDVLLMADVFEEFIKTCLEYYGLDPCHYFSSPVLNWKEKKIIVKKINALHIVVQAIYMVRQWANICTVIDVMVKLEESW